MEVKSKMEPEKELKLAHTVLGELRDLIKTEGKLKVPKEDNFFMRFIRAKKYSAALSYKNLQQYYGVRQKYPKSFEMMYPTALRHVLDSGVVRLLKHRDELGRKVFVFRVDHWDSDELSFEEITMTCVLIAEQMSLCPVNQLTGAIILVDESGLRLSHIRQLTLPALHKLILLLQDSFPGRYKALHMVNQPYVVEMLYHLAKRFISKKLVHRIKLHGDYDALQKAVTPDILPESLGGNLKEDEAWDEELVPLLLKNNNYYKEMQNYGFNKRSSIL